ncbi:MAG TPA: ABC transporter permease [Candidatus Angelobacter sp.]
MRHLRALLWRLSGLFGAQRPDADLAAELESHVALHAEDNVRSGMTSEEARRQALIKLGGMEHAQEIYRQQKGLPVLESLAQDLRYGLRMLRKNPGFAAVAIVTLALGIGANTAIFSVVNGVLLRPLPYEDPSRLMDVFNTAPSRGLPHFGASAPDFRALREQNRTLTGLSAYYKARFNLTGTEQPERLDALVVSAEYFATLGLKPFLGRGFLPSDEKWGSHRMVIVSEGFWRTHLDADRNIYGKTLNLDGETYNVVGVVPAPFTSSDVVLWLPMAWKPKDNSDSHNNYFLGMAGRLRPGITRSQAQSDLNAIMLGIAERAPENKGMGVDLQPLRETVVGNVRPALLILLGAVGLILLIACVNLANLLLARSAGRQKEIAIRSALGAGRRRLVRQFITESILLSLLGGCLGLAVAYFALTLLPMAKGFLPSVQQVRLDGWVLLFTLGISALTGVLFGLAPAFANSRVGKLNDVLKEGGRTSQAGGSSRIRTGLVVSEVALALVLLIGSGLAIKSFERLLHVDPGFDPSRVLTFSAELPNSYDPTPDPLRIGAPPRVAAFYHDVLARVEQLPGVRAAGVVSSLPLQGENWTKFFVALDRPRPASIDKLATAQYRSVDGHFFGAMGIRLLKGRLLNEHDQANAAPSVLVNETLVRQYWPGQDPIGKMVLLDAPKNLIPADQIPPGFRDHPFTVVGVVSDARYGGLDQDAQPTVYAPIAQSDFSPGSFFTVRSDGDPRALIASVRSVVAQIDKNLPLGDVATMEEIMSISVAQPRLQTFLLGLFGGLAMILAAVGIYGVMSYSVTQRTSEIGIRMALGADRASVLRMVMVQGLRLAAIGLAIGLALALAVTRVMSKILFGVSPTDPLTFATIAVLLALVALLACYFPARRATRVDPMVALRYE